MEQERPKPEDEGRRDEEPLEGELLNGPDQEEQEAQEELRQEEAREESTAAAQGQEPGAAIATVEEPPARKPGAFSAERPAGRALRAFLRYALVFLIALLVGGLLIYQLLYRPVVERLDRQQREGALVQQQLDQAWQDLKSVSTERDTAQAAADDAQQRLEIELARTNVLRAMNEITRARLAIANEDGAAAAEALDASQAYVQEILPTLSALDEKQAETLQALYTLAKNDLERDPQLAAQDFDRLQSELERAEQNVLRQPE